MKPIKPMGGWDWVVPWIGTKWGNVSEPNSTANRYGKYFQRWLKPAKAEACVVRVKFPPNFKMPTHTHPWSEVITVLSGAFGEATDDTDKGVILKPGSLLVLPANHTHRVWTTDQETVFQFSFTGPFDITFVNPADDPRKKAE